MNIHESKDLLDFFFYSLFLSLSHMLFTLRENDFIELDSKLPEQEISAGTFLKSIIKIVIALAFYIVIYIVIYMVDEEMIDLLERCHLILSVIFKIFFKCS
jgi:hypothetical protein